MESQKIKLFVKLLHHENTESHRYGNLGEINIYPVMLHKIYRNTLSLTLPNPEQLFVTSITLVLLDCTHSDAWLM